MAKYILNQCRPRENRSKYEVALGKTEDTTFSGDHLMNHFGILKWFQESRPTLPVVSLSRGNPACQT